VRLGRTADSHDDDSKTAQTWFDALADSLWHEGDAARRGTRGGVHHLHPRVPQIFGDVDRVKPRAERDAGDVTDTLQTYLGSLYVNDFDRFGRTYQVTAQPTQTSASHRGHQKLNPQRRRIWVPLEHW